MNPLNIIPVYIGILGISGMVYVYEKLEVHGVVTAVLTLLFGFWLAVLAVTCPIFL